MEKILRQFESLGDNCEFALVQGQHNVKDWGLLKWSSSPDVRYLTELIRQRFEGFYRIENLIPGGPGNLRDQKYNIGYHTAMKSTRENGVFEWSQTPEERAKVYRIEFGHVLHFSAKLIQSLQEGSKIFVYKCNQSPSDEAIAELHDVLESYGKNYLLHVRKADPGHPAGSFDIMRDRLYIGYIERFAPYNPATDFLPGAWEQLCTNVLTAIIAEAPGASRFSL